MHQVLRGHITRADKDSSDYLYIPFDLPQPARRLDVRYRYSAAMDSDQREGGNVIDIGLFDPQGAEFPGGRGFRGWSGSARDHFTITPTDATPGYLPGPLPAGSYQICLGLYRIWEHGADYEVEVRADLNASAPTASTAATDTPEIRRHSAGTRQLPAATWLCGDLQSHTEHSDAKGSVDRLVAKASDLGLDFLAVTDHNTVSHHLRLAALSQPALVLIPGQEATTYYGHMNVWGTSRWCDFRCRTDDDMAAVIRLAHRNGGVCSINHPKANGPAWHYGANLPVDAIEVWQGPWPHRNEESLAFWEQLLDAGQRVPAVGGSDYHCPIAEETGFLRLGQPTTWVKATDRSVGAILDAICRGRVSVSAQPDGPRLDITARAGAITADMGATLDLQPGSRLEVELTIERGAHRTLRVIADGTPVHETLITDPSATVRVEVAVARYVRAELVGDIERDLLPDYAPQDLDLRDWRWALSNPIYVTHGG
jgi:hypothetical protein